MSNTERPLILITNDDGIDSAGLAAAAAALDPLGDLLIVAPTVQQSGMGRAMPRNDGYDGRIFETSITGSGKTWAGYSVNASPAQAVQHAVYELAKRPITLAMSGINFGENMGIAITISGTVGAALEAAAQGIPALAVSLEVDWDLHRSDGHAPGVDWTAAMYFTRRFGEHLLHLPPQSDVDLLNINLPQQATPETPWRITRLDRRAYYRPVPPQRAAFGDEGRFDYTMTGNTPTDEQTDVGAFQAGFVSVTPISLDMTSRIDPAMFQTLDEET